MAAAARTGLVSDEARSELYSPVLPAIDPARDLGVFFTRDRPGEGSSAASDVPPASDSSGAAAKEMHGCSSSGGYAHPKAPNSPGTQWPRRERVSSLGPNLPMRLASLLGPDIKQILKEDPEALRELLDDIHAEDLADIISELEPDEAAELLARIPAEDAAPIFERLEEHEQEELVGHTPPWSRWPRSRRARCRPTTGPTSSVPAPGDGRSGLRRRSSGRRSPEAAQEVREIEKWPDTSAGHLMTPDFVAVSPRMRVSEAFEIVKQRARVRDEFVS